MDCKDFSELYTKHLSDQQKQAVFAGEGPVLVLAVPGGGKTTVLVTRLGYMIYCLGIRPEQILTLTYTTAATHDMEERFRSLFGTLLEPDAPVPEFRTINGVCAKVILWYGRQIGKAPFRLLTDEHEIRHLLSEIYREIEEDYATETELHTIRTEIAYIKNMMLSDEDLSSRYEDFSFDMAAIYRKYCGILREQKLMDYDDQMIYAHTILRKNAAVLNHFQNQYPYLCVDEAQDTSKIQHEIIRLLAAGGKSLFMVGDEDQSIYGFRAAYPEALLEFEQHHKGALVLNMEDNFRSTQAIVASADRFIQKNVLRHDKKMRSTRPFEKPIHKIPIKGAGAQYTYLAKVAADPAMETAVLYRDNENIIPLADLLERRGIPYRLKNTELSFFTDRVVSDIGKILRFAAAPSDEELFLQIYYKIASYLKKDQAQNVCALAKKHNVPILDAAIRFGRLPARTTENVRRIRTQLAALNHDTASEAVKRVCSTMGYRSYLTRSGISDRKIRILSSIARRELTPADYLSRMDELRTILENKTPDDQCRFILSTIHSSKGLEYDCVYLMDVADGIFPDQLPDSQAKAQWQRIRKINGFAERQKAFQALPEAVQLQLKAYEEERRLFYVGITRAKKELHLFELPGGSSLLNELPQYEQPVAPQPSFEKKSIEERPQPGFDAFCASLGEGVLVEHKSFGTGVVLACSPELVTVQFGDEQKTFMLRILYERNLLREL